MTKETSMESKRLAEAVELLREWRLEYRYPTLPGEIDRSRRTDEFIATASGTNAAPSGATQEAAGQDTDARKSQEPPSQSSLCEPAPAAPSTPTAREAVEVLEYIARLPDSYPASAIIQRAKDALRDSLPPADVPSAEAVRLAKLALADPTWYEENCVYALTMARELLRLHSAGGGK